MPKFFLLRKFWIGPDAPLLAKNSQFFLIKSFWIVYTTGLHSLITLLGRFQSKSLRDHPEEVEGAALAVV